MLLFNLLLLLYSLLLVPSTTVGDLLGTTVGPLIGRIDCRSLAVWKIPPPMILVHFRLVFSKHQIELGGGTPFTSSPLYGTHSRP